MMLKLLKGEMSHIYLKLKRDAVTNVEKDAKTCQYLGDNQLHSIDTILITYCKFAENKLH